MGHASYSVENRSFRAASLDYARNSIDDNFKQNKERKAHDSMLSKGMSKRICADSDSHPAVVPVIIALDVTGSMGKIPQEIVKNGLPNIMGKLLNNKIDTAICFIAIGDHECDSYPLQVGQFESGDEELDMWLTRTYLEGKGGGNNGESYQLAWLFGSRLTETDAFNKRKQKGFLFTIGDEPCLKHLPGIAINEILGTTGNEGVNSDTLLKEAQEKWNVYHLHITHSSGAKNCLNEWESRLGQHCLDVPDYTKVAQVIGDILVSNAEKLQTGNTSQNNLKPEKEEVSTNEIEIIL